MENGILYVYPVYHNVSFSLVARKHIEYLRKLKLLSVHEIDETVFANYIPHLRYSMFLHPWMYIYGRLLRVRELGLSNGLKPKFELYMDWWRSHFDQLIAVDVCDSDRLSEFAVDLLNDADKVIVPSNFAVEVCRRSGVQRPVYRVQHAVDPEWYSMPNQWETAPIKSINPALIEIYLYKLKRGKKVILYWLWHSAERKGWLEVKEFYTRLSMERRDVVLVMKTALSSTAEFQQVMHLGAIQLYGWLSEYEKMVLYDLADLTLNFSRGGGFELNCLESLARGVPCIASNWGSWTDYVPRFLQVKTGERVMVLPGSAIHVGYGYKVDVDDALNKAHDILENHDEYRGRINDYKSVLIKEYTWNEVAMKLKRVLEG